MQIPPEERPKIIALSVGIVVVISIFCTIVVPRLMPHGPNGGPPVASTPAPTTGSPTPAPPSPTGISAPAEAAAAIPGQTPAAKATDPFWRPLALSLLPPKMTVSTVRKPDSGLTATSTPGFPSSAGHGKLAPIAPPPLPEVALQGIVLDDTAMAVLSVGGQVRFMKAGEVLEGGWVLFSIQTATVVLRQGSREVVLTLGQTLLKETPQENKSTRGVAETLPPFHSVTLQP